MLDRWSGSAVSVRVVTREDALLAVFHGRLGRQSPSKHPAMFWPLEAEAGVRDAEQPGVYVHPDLVEAAAIHEGDAVVEWRQAGATLNLRRL